MAKLNILIIDYTTHHSELVGALCRTFADHAVRLVVTSSFQAKFARDFAFDTAPTLVMPKKMPMHNWLAQLAPVIAAQDIVIVSTALRDPLLLKTLKLKTCAKKVIFVHNTHYFTERFPIDRGSYPIVFGKPLASLSAWREYAQLRFKYLKRKIRHAVNGTSFKNMAANTDYFCFGSKQLTDYFSQLTAYKNVVILPTYATSVEERLPRPAYEGVLRIGIIGLVSPDRRDYLDVIRALGNAGFIEPIELHILGRCPDSAYGKQISALIAQVSSASFKVEFDPDSKFIPTEELRRRLLPIHMLLSPLRLHFAFHAHHEQYGLTKLSGAEADCLRFNRLILLPAAYHCSDHIAPFVLSYDNPVGLAVQIKGLQHKESIRAANERSINFSVKQQNAEAARRFFEKVLDEGICRPRA